MKFHLSPASHRVKIIFLIAVSGWLIFLLRGFGLTAAHKHDFEGKCQACHTEIPQAGAPFEETHLANNLEEACMRCHQINLRTSHPVGMKPSRGILLQRYLDPQGKLTCITCHDVHKEERVNFSQQELKGLLRGHARGRSFCYTCHNEELLGASWRHTLAINYAHAPGQLIQNAGGTAVDKFSIECLSCHDGVISRQGSAQVASGEFQHGIGLSHPVGVVYPRGGGQNDFVPPEALPAEIKLFNGTVGCLSCHNPYGGGKFFLVIDNFRSALCLSCHNK